MKPAGLIPVLLACVAVAGGIYASRELMTEKVSEVVEEKGLDGALMALRSTDERLKADVEEKLGGGQLAEREIDLDNPTEADVVFLKETFINGSANARLSAARVLVEIQEPRAVGLLSRALGTDEEQAVFCAGAVDILRMQSRSQAAELILEVLEDPHAPPSDSCKDLLEEKLTFIQGRAPDLLPGFLESRRRLVRLYALRVLPPSGDAELKDAVERLAMSTDAEENQAAEAWIKASREQFGGD